MRKVVLSLCMVICVAACTSPAWAQGALDQRISELSQKISNGLTENQKRTIAVVEFADLRGNVTDFGRFIAEELITRLYETKKFTVIERQLLNKVVTEQKLSLTGMIDQTSAQKLGKLLGVDAIATGTVTDLGKSLRVNARLIDTSTAVIFAVAATEIAKDDSVMALMGATNTVPTSTSGGGTSDQVANAIASKDVGPLRVLLKSVMPMKFTDEFGRRVNGIRCSFEFMNRETQRPIAAAMHAWPFGSVDNGIAYYNYGGVGSGPGNVLRTTLLDDRGTVWSLSPSGVTGMSSVSVGRSDSGSVFSPTDIPSLLQRQDETGTNMSPFARSNPFVFGSATPIPAGQSVAVVMSFAQDLRDMTSAPPKSFQIVTEIVVGIVTTGTKKSYTLHNVTFDQVSVRAGGQ